jgi:hypothetical protein
MLQALALWLAFAIHPGRGEIKGRVTAEVQGEATKEPIRNAQIRLYSLEQVLSTKTNESGDFVFENVFLGSYSLVVEANGFKSLRKPVSVTEKQPISTLQLAISAASDPANCNAPVISYGDYQPRPTGHLSLEATDSSKTGRSLPGVVFSIKGPSGGSEKSYTLQARNGAAAMPLAPGSYTVSVRAPDFTAQETSVFVPRDNVTRVLFSVVRKTLQVACQ